MTAPKLPEGLEPVAWSKVRKDHMPRMRMLNESYLQGAWDVPLVRLSDAQAALQAQAAEKDAEIAALKLDAARLDGLETMLLQAGTVYLLPCGADLRFVQVRSVGEVTNYPTVLGLRAAIDSAIALAAKEAK